MTDYTHVALREPSSRPEAGFSYHKTHIHRPRKLDVDSDSVPTFFWPLVTLLLSIAVALICWGAYNQLPKMASGGEKPLAQGLPVPRFNTTSAEAPAVEIPELLPEPELIELAVIANGTDEPPLLMPPPSPVLPSPVPVEPPPLALPKVELPFGLAPVPPPALASPPPVSPGLPQVAMPPEIHAAKLAPLPPPENPVQVAPMNPLVYRESTSGDTPMLRNWKTLALYSLVTTTVFVQVPVPVAAGEKDDNKILLKRIDDFQESVKKSFERVDTAQDAAKEAAKKSFEGLASDIGGIKGDLQAQKGDLKKIREDIDILKDDGIKQRLDLASANTKIKQIDNALEKIRADLDMLRAREPSAGVGLDKASVEDIKAKLSAIEQAILKLQPTTGRIALSPPAAPSTGRVLLVNLYPEELLFLVNQKSYRVAPGANVPVENVPAGALTYEVISGTWGLRARSTTNLAPNETFTLTAR